MINNNNSNGLIRVGVFYDGNYFYHVSNYYNYVHDRRSRLSISGLHDFIRSYIADSEGVDVNVTQIVDAHYFRGRLNAREASQRGNQLYYDRVFDDILMSEGVITHYLPLKVINSRIEDKGIDVWLALEAFELAMYKQFNVVVLIASDGNYVSLVRKLNTRGTKVMVLGWDFEYTDDHGRTMMTRTSQDLLSEVTYPVHMHEIIDDPDGDDNPSLSNLFVQPSLHIRKTFDIEENENGHEISEVLSLKNGYGFIRYPNNNLFFYYGDVIDTDFNELHEGDMVTFTVEKNEEGQNVARDIRKVDP